MDGQGLEGSIFLLRTGLLEYDNVNRANGGRNISFFLDRLTVLRNHRTVLQLKFECTGY